jgi:hypothetical protein
MDVAKPSRTPQPSPLTDQEVNAAQAFLGYAYPESKDLAKHFLTVVAVVLTFSVTFSERSSATPPHFLRLLLLSSWVLSIAAIVLDGLAIVMVFEDGLAAKYEVTYHSRHPRHARLASPTFKCLTMAGICFVLSLLMLALAGMARLLS